MKRALAVVAGVAIGVLLAGVLSPMLALLLPARLRGAWLIWAVAVTTATATAAAFWWMTGRLRR